MWRRETVSKSREVAGGFPGDCILKTSQKLATLPGAVRSQRRGAGGSVMWRFCIDKVQCQVIPSGPLKKQTRNLGLETAAASVGQSPSGNGTEDEDG